MKAKINKTLIRGLEPQARPFEVYDTGVSGFLLRVQPSGAMTYYVVYRLPDGQRNRKKLGRAETLSAMQARDKATKILAQVAQGEDPGEQKNKYPNYTLRGYLDEIYEPWLRENRKGGTQDIARLRHSFASLLDVRIDGITRWLIEKWQSSRRKANATPATLNRDLTTLKAALNRAVDWGFIAENQIARTKRFAEDHSRKVRYLKPEEEIRLLQALDEREEHIRQERDSANAWRRERGHGEYTDLRAMPFADYLKPLIMTLLHTGMRRGEAFNLVWADVNFENRQVTVQGQGAKTMQTRHVSMNDTVFALLRDWRRQTSGAGSAYVFPGKNGARMDNIKKSWERLLREAGIENFRLHDLRHTFASKLMMDGENLYTVQKLLGHSTIAMTEKYAHLAPDVMANAVKRLDKPANIAAFPAPATEAGGQ